MVRPLQWSGTNRVLDTLRQVISHGEVHGHLETNPARGTRRNPRRTLNRFLSQDEARRLHDELDRLVAECPAQAAQADIIRLLSYTIDVVNRDQYKTPEGDPMEKPIDVALEDMGDPHMMGNVRIVEAPARSRFPPGLRDKRLELMDSGEEFLIVPVNRPERVTGVERATALLIS